MKTSRNGIELIKKFEGCSLESYKLKKELFYTIGYGHSFDIKIGKNTVWTSKQAEENLIKDLIKYENYVNSAAVKYKFQFNQNEFDSLVSYCYNRGKGGLLQLLKNSKDKTDIATNFVVYWGSAVLYEVGLKRRREEEKKLFTTLPPNPYLEPATNLYYRIPMMNSVGVKWLQYELRCLGHKIEIDGIFGKETNRILRIVQKKAKLKADGWCGKITREFLKNN